MIYLWIPQSRPPPLTLSDLECIKTIGESHCKVLLVKSTRKSHRLDSEHLFALKAIPRKHVRENAVRLSLEIAHGNESTLIKAHQKGKSAN